MSKSEITLIAIHATYASGHMLATYRSSPPVTAMLRTAHPLASTPASCAVGS